MRQRSSTTSKTPDTLTGGLGLKWFVVSAGDTLDLTAGEQKLTV
jgi:hypothetical protein